MTCSIRIKQLILSVEIGVYPNERGKKQTIIANIDITIDEDKALKSDSIDDSLNYHHWASDIRKALESTNFHLLESLAQFMADHLKNYSQHCKGCRIELSKPNIIEQAASCGVVLERQW